MHRLTLGLSLAVIMVATLASRSMAANGHPKCHLSEMETCFTKLHQLKDGTHDPSFLLTSTDGLNRICRVLKVDFVGCILEYLKKCGTPLHKELSKVLSDAILEHMEQICSPNSQFREEILQTSPCIHEKVLSQKNFQRECNNPFFTTVAWGEEQAHADVPLRSPMDFVLETGCCAYRRWEECSLPKIREECNTKSENILLMVVSKLLGGVPNFMCYQDSFAKESEICRSMPELEQQMSQVNYTYADGQTFSFFSLLKMFLTRDAS